MENNDYVKYLLYFDRSVLNYYRDNSHVYKVIEDEIGGEIRISQNWKEDDNDKYPYIEIKFGFRKLKNGEVCIVVFGPTFLNNTSKKDLKRWNGYIINERQFKEKDDYFNRWVKRYILGSWDVEDGSRKEIENKLDLISALTKHKTGIPLFKCRRSILLNYPKAENEEEYKKANLELYRLIIDGLDPNAIIELAKLLNNKLSDESKTLNSLKEILPEELIDKIHTPLRKLRDRRSKIHKTPSENIKRLNAFDRFDLDLKEIANCLNELLLWFEEIFNIDAESCKGREGSMKYFPKFIGPPRPGFKLDDLKKIINKRIKSVEFGEVEKNEDCHEAEAIIFYFYDGSSMSIDIHSNAYNLKSEYGIPPNEVHTSLDILWDKPIKPKNG